MTDEPGPPTVKVIFPVEPAIAEMLLRDDALRARVGRLVSRLLSGPSGTTAANLAAELRSAHTPDHPEPTDGA